MWSRVSDIFMQLQKYGDVILCGFSPLVFQSGNYWRSGHSSSDDGKWLLDKLLLKCHSGQQSQNDELQTVLETLYSADREDGTDGLDFSLWVKYAAGDIFIILIIYKSHKKTKTNNRFILLTCTASVSNVPT